MQLGTSGVWLLGAPGLSSSSAPRCSSLVGTKKSFSRLRLKEIISRLRKSILKSFVQKRPFRNAVKRNLPLRDLGEPRTTLQCLKTDRRLPATSTNSGLQPALRFATRAAFLLPACPLRSLARVLPFSAQNHLRSLESLPGTEGQKEDSPPPPPPSTTLSPWGLEPRQSRQVAPFGRKIPIKVTWSLEQRQPTSIWREGHVRNAARRMAWKETDLSSRGTEHHDLQRAGAQELSDGMNEGSLGPIS